jgi:hypothetical protein
VRFSRGTACVLPVDDQGRVLPLPGTALVVRSTC